MKRDHELQDFYYFTIFLYEFWERLHFQVGKRTHWNVQWILLSHRRKMKHKLASAWNWLIQVFSSFRFSFSAGFFFPCLNGLPLLLKQFHDNGELKDFSASYCTFFHLPILVLSLVLLFHILYIFYIVSRHITFQWIWIIFLLLIKVSWGIVTFCICLPFIPNMYKHRQISGLSAFEPHLLFSRLTISKFSQASQMLCLLIFFSHFLCCTSKDI